MDFKNKYLKYKKKYLELKKKQIGGGNICEGKKVVVVESADSYELLLKFYRGKPFKPWIFIGKKKLIVPMLFYKKIYKFFVDCFYESIISALKIKYKDAVGNILKVLIEIINLTREKNFLETKFYKRKHLSFLTEDGNDELNTLTRLQTELGGIFAHTNRKAYILAEKPKVSNNKNLNDYDPISVITVYSNYSTKCDYYIANFCTTARKRGKGCGRILLENVLKKLKGVICLEVAKDSKQTKKSHDSLVKYYEKFGFKVFKKLKDATLMKKINK
jgi:ribosomal protein S18 acetylase RimI-like enzyme